jgi:signal transduction histidine kinase
MHFLKNWPRSLLTLPFAKRLGIVTLSFLLFVGLYMLTYSVNHNAGFVAIPIAMAAWIFKKRGLFLCFAATIIVLAVFHTIRLGTIIWPSLFILLSFTGLITALIIGFIIVTLRNLLDSADAARLIAMQAEKQSIIAYQQQLQLNQLKNQFILNVNHELRNPLTVTHSYLELLNLIMKQEGQINREKHGEYLTSAVLSCQELASLVNNVLDALEISNDKMSLQLEELPVATVVHEIVEQFHTFAPKDRHPIHLEIPEHLTVRANVQCLRYVLRNLLSNAFKYAPVETPITIRAALNAESSQRVNISVEDLGPGIPPEDIPLLFGQFVRLKRDLAGPVRGTGLGLYVCKNLVEAMEGHIWVESPGIPGQGSSFGFTLPCVLPQ